MTKADIIREIHKLESAGVTLYASVIYQYNKDLCFEACERFGSVKTAVVVAGYEYPEIDDKTMKCTPEEIQRFRSLIATKRT